MLERELTHWKTLAAPPCMASATLPAVSATAFAVATGIAASPARRADSFSRAVRGAAPSRLMMLMPATSSCTPCGRRGALSGHESRYWRLKMHRVPDRLNPARLRQDSATSDAHPGCGDRICFKRGLAWDQLGCSQLNAPACRPGRPAANKKLGVKHQVPVGLFMFGFERYAKFPCRSRFCVAFRNPTAICRRQASPCCGRTGGA